MSVSRMPQRELKKDLIFWKYSSWLTTHRPCVQSSTYKLATGLGLGVIRWYILCDEFQHSCVLQSREIADCAVHSHANNYEVVLISYVYRNENPTVGRPWIVTYIHYGGGNQAMKKLAMEDNYGGCQSRGWPRARIQIKELAQGIVKPLHSAGFPAKCCDESVCVYTGLGSGCDESVCVSTTGLGWGFTQPHVCDFCYF